MSEDAPQNGDGSQGGGLLYPPGGEPAWKRHFPGMEPISRRHEIEKGGCGFDLRAHSLAATIAIPVPGGVGIQTIVLTPLDCPRCGDPLYFEEGQITVPKVQG